MKTEPLLMLDIVGAVNPPVRNEGSEYTVKTRTGDVFTVPYDTIPELRRTDGTQPQWAGYTPPTVTGEDAA